MNFDPEALQTVREARFLINEYDAWLFDEFQPYLGQRILEIGCGLGNQMYHFLDRELVVGIDISNHSVLEVQRQFVDHPNVQAFNISITESKILSLEKMEFDTAISVNVFEHIENDEIAIKNVHSLLEPKGMFILVVPAHMWLYGTMDRQIGHFRRYTKDNLKNKCEKYGFHILELKYVNMAGALGWLINGRLLKRRVPPTGQLRLFNLLVPGFRTLENFITPLFGVSLICIAQK